MGGYERDVIAYLEKETSISRKIYLESSLVPELMVIAVEMRSVHLEQITSI